jgi:TRAP-type uncharacterized transport system fused permease subunit
MAATSLAGASIIVVAFIHTYVGLSFANVIISLSHGIYLLAVLFMGITGIILGMGGSNLRRYVIASVLVAHALIKLGTDLVVRICLPLSMPSYPTSLSLSLLPHMQERVSQVRMQ